MYVYMHIFVYNVILKIWSLLITSVYSPVMFQGLGLGNLDQTLTLNQNPEAFCFSLHPVCFFNGCSFHCEITNKVVQRCREGVSSGIGVIMKPSAVITPTFLPSSHAFWPNHRDMGFGFVFTVILYLY